MNKLIAITVIIGILLLIDLYVYQGLLVLTKDGSHQIRNIARYSFWGLTLVSLTALLWVAYGNPFAKNAMQIRSFVVVGIGAIYFSKIFGMVFILIDDLQRGIRWVAGLFNRGASGIPGEAIPRSEFLVRTALVASSIPLGLMTFGIISGAHDYRVRRLTIK